MRDCYKTIEKSLENHLIPTGKVQSQNFGKIQIIYIPISWLTFQRPEIYTRLQLLPGFRIYLKLLKNFLGC